MRYHGTNLWMSKGVRRMPQGSRRQTAGAPPAGAASPRTGRGALTGAGQPTPRSARLASYRPTVHDARPVGARPATSRATREPVAEHPRRREGTRPGRQPARTSARARTGGRGGAPGRRTAGAAAASPARRAAEIALNVLAALVMIVVAIARAIGGAVAGLIGGRRRRATFSPATRTNRYARRTSGSSWRRGGRGPVLRLHAVAAPACLGVLALTLLSGIFFVPAIGADASSEAKLFDLAPINSGQAGISTPRSAWKQGTMPYLFQTDPVWANKPYAGGTVAANGCGPTCLTMVYVYLTGKSDLSPADMCARADDGNYAPTGATEWRFMAEEPKRLGFSSKELTVTSDAVATALREGKPVVCAVRPGDFTSTGHFIVVSGIDENGSVSVHDPNSSLRSAQKWDLERVLRQTNACWSFSA